MDQQTRRTLEELEERYRLEPELRDVYVEGATDATYFQWFLEKVGCENAVVYEVSTVNIPRSLVEKKN